MKTGKRDNMKTLNPESGKALLEEQAKYNDGRGSTMARTVAMFLERGDNQSARNIWNIDRDHVRQYPGLMAYMNELFGTNHI